MGVRFNYRTSRRSSVSYGPGVILAGLLLASAATVAAIGGVAYVVVSAVQWIGSLFA